MEIGLWEVTCSLPQGPFYLILDKTLFLLFLIIIF